MTEVNAKEDGILKVTTDNGGQVTLDAFVVGSQLSKAIAGVEPDDTESQKAAMNEVLAAKGLPGLSHRVQLRIYKSCLDLMEEAQKKDGLIQQQDAGAGSHDSTT